MSLTQYRKKRSSSTPEPKGKVVKKKGQQLVFCVQKHDASRLHYDFRLEYKGVLLSWAVPKGPSLNPQDKHLAIQVEDHPFEYRHFEGVIPKGNYGAGTVIIWDEGTYTVPGGITKKEMEKRIEEGLKKGHLDIELDGEKLKGGFTLIKLKNSNKENEWLLFKRQDQHVSKKDVLKKERSVRTAARPQPKTKKMPGFFKPMLSKLAKESFDDDEWLFEVKWDGYRTLAYLDKNVNLYSRNNLSFNKLFPKIVEELSQIKGQAILDGEVVILDKEGKAQFQLMQNYQRTQQGNLFYYVFDLLFVDGVDIRDYPLTERKKMLEQLIPFNKLSHIRLSKHIHGKGKKFFQAAQKQELEGIMAKKMDSPYRAGKRSSEWLKIKTHKRQEVVIGGFTQPRGSRSHFGALLVGIYNEHNQFEYVGHVGGGFDTALLNDLIKKMDPLIQEKCPFHIKPRTNSPATWIKPSLVCEVSFREWTTDGNMRQPIFEGLRIDKKAKQVRKEG